MTKATYISCRIKFNFGQNLIAVFARQKVRPDKRRVGGDDVGRRDDVAVTVGEGDVTLVSITGLSEKEKVRLEVEYIKMILLFAYIIAR